MPLPRNQFGVSLNRERYYYFLLLRKEYAIGDLKAITTQTLSDLEKKLTHSEPWGGTQCFVWDVCQIFVQTGSGFL